MTNHIDHSNCDHDRTSKARAACRKARRDGTAQAMDLIQVFNSRNLDWDPRSKWVFYAASRFAQVRTEDEVEAAKAVLAYFLPSGDDARDANRRANGYTVTTDFHTMLRITLNAAS